MLAEVITKPLPSASTFRLQAAGLLQHINIAGSRKKDLIDPCHFCDSAVWKAPTTLTLHDIILPLERRSPGTGRLFFGGFVAASFVEGMG